MAPNVVIGKTYAIVVRQPATTRVNGQGIAPDAITWDGDLDNPTGNEASACPPGAYADGRMWTQDHVSLEASSDMYFTTYVKPAAAKKTLKVTKHAPPFCKPGQKTTKRHPCRPHIKRK